MYNSSLFVFGGYNGQVVLNDFYEFRFEPVIIPPPTLIDDLRALINHREFSDVTFVVDDQVRARFRARLRFVLYFQRTEVNLRQLSRPGLSVEPI